jgi:uncharacterized membrane protein
MNKNRLEAFSDGVFAIVITLLVLEIKVPHVPENELKQALIALLPKYFSFALSFIIIGVYWVSHHSMLHFIVKTDRVSLWLNMLVLFTICIIPFPTAIIGDYPNSFISILVYGVTLAAVNLSGGLFWAYCTKNNRLSDHKLDHKFARKITILHLSPCLLYITAILLSLISNTISYIIFIGVPLFFIIPNRFLRKMLSNAYSNKE